MSDIRTDAMQLLYRNGKTLEQIGDLFGITRERVRQLLKSRGINREHGGAHVKSVSRTTNRAWARLRYEQWRCQHTYLCSPDDLADARSRLTNPQQMDRIYHQHRARAQREYMPWQVPYPHLAQLIAEHLPHYGRGKFCRVLRMIDHARGYVPGNLEVVTLAESSRRTQEQLGNTRTAERRKQLLQLYNTGLSVLELADNFGWSVNTVKNYLAIEKRRTKMAIVQVSAER